MINLKLVMQIYKEKRVKLVSESQYRQLWEVDSHTVIFQLKKGRRILTCDCENHARFCNSSALCYHKEAVMAFPIIDAIQKEINKKIENIKAIGMGADKKIIDTILFEMDDLVRLLWVRQLKFK